jgi:EmrB/QacA subfamily drug resistance transporter
LFKKKIKQEETDAPAKKENVDPNIRKTRNFIMLGLALGLLLASLDSTIVGTSLPHIVAELGGMDLYAWLFTAYMLTETVMIPIGGKLSDRYGRRPIFLAGMFIFLAGSILAGLSQSMEELIVFRAMQGLGGGVMMPVSMATVADLYAPTERGKVQGMLGAVFALSSIIGPLIGGFIVDNMDWRWVFYVNVPVGIAAIAITTFKFPKIEADRTKKIDYAGMTMLTIALLTFLLVVTWGGADYAWNSVEIISLSVISVISLVAFIWIEHKAEDPVMPLHLFKEPIFSLGCISLLILAIGMFGVISYLPLFLQAVIGMSATYSGEVLVPLMIGVMIGSIASGFALKRFGYKIFLVTGPLLSAFGLYLLSTLHVGSSMDITIVYLFITGIGLGFCMSNYIVAAQNVVKKNEIGITTSGLSLFRGVGGTIGVAVLGSIMNRRMVTEINNNLSAEAMASLPTTNVTKLGEILISSDVSSLDPSIVEAIRLSLSNSITYMFLIGAIFLVMAWFTSLFIKSVPLKTSDEYHELEIQDEKAPRSEQ